MNKRQRKKLAKKRACALALAHEQEMRLADCISDSGLRRIAAAMSSPIRVARDYRHIGHNLIAIQPFPGAHNAIVETMHLYDDTIRDIFGVDFSRGTEYTIAPPEFVGTIPRRVDVPVIPDRSGNVYPDFTRAAGEPSDDPSENA